MSLAAPLVRLPLAFDAPPLAAEGAAVSEGEWRPARGLSGSISVAALVAPDGDAGATVARSPLAPTPILERSPHLRRLLAAFRSEVGFTTLLRLSPGSELPVRAEADGRTLGRIELLVPLVASPVLVLRAGGLEGQAEPGTCWSWDTWLPHGIANGASEAAVVLVSSAAPSPRLLELVAAGAGPAGFDGNRPASADAEPAEELRLERGDVPAVLPPEALSPRVDLLLDALGAGRGGAAAASELAAAIRVFQADWVRLWDRDRDRPEGWAAARSRLVALDVALRPFEGRFRLPNGLDAAEAARDLLLRPAFAPQLATAPRRRAARGGSRTASREAEPALPSRPRTQPLPQAPPPSDAVASEHSASFAALLDELHVSLALVTGPVGHLVVARWKGGTVDAAVRSLAGARAIAAGPGLLAVATRSEVQTFRNVPAAARRLEPGEGHDGCFLPRGSRVTGELGAGDLAFAGDELWITASRFSCLATLDGVHSFVPRWRPPFVTRLAPDDRCRLSGLAVVDGAPRFATILGRSDLPQGWRREAARGGEVLHVPSGEAAATGLGLPHAPRWHLGRLWLLESGRGALVSMDPRNGALTTVAVVPGFARALAFAGAFAFVAVSRPRGGPAGGDGVLAGVHAVSLTSGRRVGLLRFTSGVEEVRGIAVLQGTRFPELQVGPAGLAATTYVLPDRLLSPGEPTGGDAQ